MPPGTGSRELRGPHLHNTLNSFINEVLFKGFDNWCALSPEAPPLGRRLRIQRPQSPKPWNQKISQNLRTIPETGPPVQSFGLALPTGTQVSTSSCGCPSRGFSASPRAPTLYTKQHTQGSIPSCFHSSPQDDSRVLSSSCQTEANQTHQNCIAFPLTDSLTSQVR